MKKWILFVTKTQVHILSHPRRLTTPCPVHLSKPPLILTTLTAREVCDSLKVRFIGVDRVRAARLGMLRGDFDRLRMADSEALDAYAMRLSAMMERYASLGETLDDAAL